MVFPIAVVEGDLNHGLSRPTLDKGGNVVAPLQGVDAATKPDADGVDDRRLTGAVVTKKNIEDLEHVDEKFLRNIFGNAHVKTPLEALYLETGCVPIRYLQSFSITRRTVS